MVGTVGGGVALAVALLPTIDHWHPEGPCVRSTLKAGQKPSAARVLVFAQLRVSTARVARDGAISRRGQAESPGRMPTLSALQDRPELPREPCKLVKARLGVQRRSVLQAAHCENRGGMSEIRVR